MTYLVVIEEAGSAAVSPESLVAAVGRRWPDARPVVDPGAIDQSRVVEWEAPVLAGGVVDVAVNKAFTCFFLDGTPEGSAEVMSWIREVVDDAVGLTVCDDGYSFDFALEPGASPGEIERRL